MSTLQIEADIIINDDITIKHKSKHKIRYNSDIMKLLKDSIFQNGKYKIKHINITSIKILDKCSGCEFDHPGQLAHMGFNGCLF